MCHLCKTRSVIERIEKQLKNIDQGGAVSLDAVRSVLEDARVDLGRYGDATSVMELILAGAAKIDLVAVGGRAPHAGHKHKEPLN